MTTHEHDDKLISADELFANFPPPYYPDLPYYRVEVGEYQKDQDDPDDRDYNMLWEGEMFIVDGWDAAREVEEAFNDAVIDIYSNGDIFKEYIEDVIVTNLRELEGDNLYNTLKGYSEDHSKPLDNYACYVSVVFNDPQLISGNEYERRIYSKIIDMFEDDKDIITLPVKNAKKTK